MSALLDVRRLRIAAARRGGPRSIVRSLDLHVAPGETVGIVGESGSGKTMTARALVGLLPAGVHAGGDVVVRDRNLLSLGERELRRVRGREVALLLQDPFTMLNPLMRIGKQIVEGAPPARRSRGEAVRRLSEVGIGDPSVADRYPFQLSGGMLQRVGLAAALASDPDILIADEPSTALDVTTQQEILTLLRRVQEARGMGLVLITHDLRVAFSICERIYVLYAGSLLEVASGARLEAEPLHPYTLGLLLSEPSVTRRFAELPGIAGSVPSPDEVAGRCPFTTRCLWAAERCTASDPPLRELEPGRLSACVRVEEIRGEMAANREAAEARAAPAVTVRSAAQPLLRVDDVVKQFGQRGDAQALGGVSIDVGAGESVGLVGESGSGKTTLARCLVGLETPTSGGIVLDGVDISDYARLSAADRRRIRRTVQMIFQDPYSSLNPVRTIGATLQEALNAGSDRAASPRDLLVRVGLAPEYASRKPASLSGGERQRVAIARALALGPKLIVCDEPVSALDVSVQAQILNLFKSLREELGIGYVFITHDLAVVRQITDRMYVLYRGELVESGRVADVLDAPTHPYTARLVASVPRSDPEWLTERR